MEYLQTDLMTVLPEMVVLVMAMFILLADLFLEKNNRFIIYGLAQFTLFIAAVITFQTHTPAVGYAFNDMLVDDTLSDVLKLLTYLGTSMMFVYTRHYLQQRNMFRGEYYAMVLLSMVGMMVMISSHHMLSMYIGLELLSLCLYGLVAFDRDNAQSSEAAMKYFVLGALASGMLLYGMSMVYGFTGSLDFANIATAVASQPHHKVLILGLVFIIAGLAFKLGAVPFHMWVPDVYQGANTTITMLISTVPKFAAFAMVIRFIVQSLYSMSVDWQQMFLLMALASIVVGNYSALVQTNLKRMLAYSTISHIGFLLFGLMSASLNGFASSMFYITAYVMMGLAGFGMILLLSRADFEAGEIDDLKGLNQRSPWLAFMMLITMFSMAGVPPTLGFYAKFSVLQSAWHAGYTWPVVFAVLMAVIGAFYYLNIVRKMYFDAPVDLKPIDAPMDMRMVLSINALALLAFGLFPQILLNICGGAMITSLQ